MLEYKEGSITGMGHLSPVNTELKWLLRAFSWPFVIGLSFTLRPVRVGMRKFSLLLSSLMTRIVHVLDLFLECHQLVCLHTIYIGFVGIC